MFIGHDLGTSSDKAVLIEASGCVLAHASAGYALQRSSPERAEQDPREWWRAVCETTRALLRESGVGAERVRGLGFAGQMLTLVSMDTKGEPTRPALSWLDARASEEAYALRRRLGGEHVLVRLAGGSPTAKDILPKLAWLRLREPEVYARTHAFGDATSYLVARATGRIALDPTAAGATGVLDLKRRRWSRLLGRLAGLPFEKMPELVECTAVAGELLPEPARDLGLLPGMEVAMGMADIPAAAVGAGAGRVGGAHLYLGTSGWVGVVSTRPRRAARAGIAAVPGPAPGTSLWIGEMETAGACRSWARDWLEVDEAGFDELALSVEPGCGGLLFAPHLFGERAPYPDAAIRGAFVGLDLGQGRAELARAVLEGVALNLREVLHAMDAPPGELRVVGGGARSDAWLGILADVTGRTLTRVERPPLAGAVGVALTAAVAVGTLPDLDVIVSKIETGQRFTPDERRGSLYAERALALERLRPALSRYARRK